MFPVTPLTGGVTAALSALPDWPPCSTDAAERPDQVYLGLARRRARGGAGDQHRVRDLRRPGGGAIHPAAGCPPGELRTLVDATADNRT